MNEIHWYKIYRPTQLKEFTFPNFDIEEIIDGFYLDKDIPDLLLSGIQGTGKSTMARMLITMLDASKFDTKIVNGSTNNGIDFIRSIEDWTKTLPLGKYKVVLFEEADRLSAQAQDALKSVIEDSPTNVKFIFTCNHQERIIPALHSRFQHLHFTELDKDSIIERVVFILQKEDISIENEDFITDHINTYYPDFRKIINSLQESSMSGTLKGVITQTNASADYEQWELIWKDTPDKQDLLELAMSIDITTPDDIYNIMVDNVSNLPEDLQEEALIHISEHVYRAGFVGNQNLCLSACIVKIFG